MIKNVLVKNKIVSIVAENIRRDIDLKVTIWDSVHTKTHVAVLLSSKELSGTENHNRNIICLDEKGQEIWRIENPDLLTTSKRRTTSNAFSTMFFKDDKRLRVGTWIGGEVDVDINTGKFISKWEFVK